MNSILKLKQLFSLIIFLLLIITTSRAQSVDFGSPTDPPLLKKVGAYNAGIIPYNNYTRDLDKFREVNFSTFRIDLSLGKGNSFTYYEPVTGTYNNPSYNFIRLDDLAKKMISKNVLPVYDWCYIPYPFQSGGNFRNLDTTLANWQTAWQNMHMQFSKHFKDAGIKIGQHEIMNEPDLGTIVSDPNSAFLNKTQYTNGVFKDMYKYATLGIKQGDPDAMVGGYAAACGECSGYFVTWIIQNNLPLDFYTYHNYGDGTSYPGELNAVRGILNQPSLKTCDTYITEFNWTGNGSNSDLHHYKGAYQTLNRINDILSRTDINFVHWAQFMETGGSDQLGTIQSNGQRLAVFNALKVFGDMPVDRKTLKLLTNNSALVGMASSNNHKAAILIWNTTASVQPISLPIKNLPFSNGTLNLYKIDATHASLGDGAPENLVAEGTVTNVNSGYIWQDSIPAYGVVYITINDGTARDFHSEDYLNLVAKDVRIWHYWGDGVAANVPQRSKTNYAEFDRKTWTAYIGEGNYSYAYSITAVEAEQLPSKIHALFANSGKFITTDKNSLLGLRIDYKTDSSYTKSILFYDSIYNSSRDAEMPWGTKLQADSVVKVNLPDFKFNPADYAPAGWSGRVIISFILQNTGVNTRSTVTLKNALLEDIKTPIQSNQPDFSIYPNPVENGYLYADLSDLNKNNIYTVSIFDIQGRKIFEKNNASPNLLAIPISGMLQSGMYFLNVKGKNYFASKKFVVK